MRSKKILITAMLMTAAMSMSAQRHTDKLDRGLVAVPGASSGNFVSWRIFAEEYYDTEYNLYRNGVKINDTPLKVSNFVDAGGGQTSSYQVEAIVRGVAQEKCPAVKRWANQYLEFPVATVLSRDGSDVTANYDINEAALGDVNGDGISEFIVKRRNVSNLTDLTNKTCFNMLECYDITGKRLWYIDLGPNMIAGPDEQYDAVAYDWDCDGKAEVLLRGADNMILHTADGQAINIGSMTVDTRWDGMEYTSTGAEYLLYLDGETGVPYQIGPSSHPDYMDYPLERGLDSDWGKGIVGHRSSKHYFAAPFLDGRKASIFLGRGAYTKHLMAAFDVDPATHQLTQRWTWNCTTSGSGWFGQGYHNFAIADVDWDGRDEIVFGSMVIDDNGKGLSTTGLGHGDAQHCGDLDPYRHGQEQFACNENMPNMNYRNATTSKFYFRSEGTSDDGRALMGNFSNKYPGMLGRSVNTGMVSSVADKVIPEIDANSFLLWSDLNFRIFWDGDLLDEVLNSPGTEKEVKIQKPGVGRLLTTSGCKTVNWSKNNPTAQGDIFGDWREEFVTRTSDNKYIRIYTTNIPTEFALYTLWHDHQYRQAMVTESMGYNQPPHPSYFVGELEGITIAPPPLTMTDRVEVVNGGTIGGSNDGQHVLVCETANTNISVSDGAAPYIATFNVPSWVQGNDNNNNITYDYFTCNVTGGAFTGGMRLVKQGDGILNLPKVDQLYTGNTDIWAGTVNFDGTLRQSSLWLNRFAQLNSNGGVFRSIRMDYGSVLRPGCADNMGAITTDSLLLGFGSRVVIDIYSDGLAADKMNIGLLSIEKKNWEYGPQYSTPIIEFVPHFADGGDLAEGRYLIATIDNIEGNISDIKVEGLGTSHKTILEVEGNNLYLVVTGLRDAASVVWTGAESSVWDLGATENFTLNGQEEASVFVTGDKVLFDDTAVSKTVNLNSEVEADSVIFDNSSAYTVSGSGSIIGNTVLVKRGSGTLTLKTDNSYTGGTRISGGVLSVSTLANENLAMGNLGGVTTTAAQMVIENGATLRTTAGVTQGSPMKMETEAGGVLDNSAEFVAKRSISGTLLTKKGAGALKIYTNNTMLNKLVITAGSVSNMSCTKPAMAVELKGGTISETDECSTSYPIEVAAGKTATWRLGNRASYTNKITGSGTLNIYCPLVDGGSWMATRTQVACNFSAFEGTIVPQVPSGDYRFSLNNSGSMPLGTMNIAEGIEVQNYAKTFHIGKVSGSGSLGGICSFSSSSPSGVNTWKVGNETNFSWSGKVTGTGTKFVKVGTGRMTVSGIWNNTGSVTVSEGELAISMGKSVGTGPLVVEAGGKLSGVTSSNTLTNSSYTIRGGLQVGMFATATTGKIDFGGKDVNISETGTLYVVKSANSNPRIVGINTLTMNGTISVILADGYEPKDGDTITLWETTTVKGTPQFDLPELALGLKWDTSEVMNGVLKIYSDPTAISVISGDNAGQINDIYNLKGQLVRKNATSVDGLPRGVYLQNGKKIVVK